MQDLRWAIKNNNKQAANLIAINAIIVLKQYVSDILTMHLLLFAVNYGV